MKDEHATKLTALDAKMTAVSAEPADTDTAIDMILHRIREEASAGNLSLSWHGMMNEKMTVALKELGYELFPHDNDAYAVISWHLKAEERPPAGK